ncbi:MAG: type II toxin-antitoxin system RelE/ParE family toxin [Chloroflexota bacterium]
MSSVVYHVRPDDSEPVRDWIYAQDGSVRPQIMVKIQRLRLYGQQLEGTKSLVPIRGPDAGLWELKGLGSGWRIVVYYDLSKDRFVLLHGFRKRGKKKDQEAHFAAARELLHEYQKFGGCSNE